MTQYCACFLLVSVHKTLFQSVSSNPASSIQYKSASVCFTPTCHRAIKSLETSLGVSADNLSGSPDLYIKMARAPVGPPSWKQVRRRPHAYEEVNSQEDDQGDWTSQEARKTSADVEMDWDETDLGIVKTKSGMVKEGSRLRSASQPNLLRDMDGELDSAFPHLKKPPRVSDEAFQLRKLRLIKHKYEDVDMAEWPDVGLNAESVGDVNALTSAIKESWLESDQTPGDGKLPKGWQRMKDEKERLYYWHVPTGRTQYSNPTSQEIKRLVSLTNVLFTRCYSIPLLVLLSVIFVLFLYTIPLLVILSLLWNTMSCISTVQVR